MSNNENESNFTATTESRAATAKISTQETTGRPQTLSTSALIWSTTSNPLTEFRLPRAFFSLSKLDVESKRSEPSQPCNTMKSIQDNE